MKGFWGALKVIVRFLREHPDLAIAAIEAAKAAKAKEAKDG